MQPFKVDWRPAAIEDVRALFEYLAENASLWDAEHVTDRVLRCTGAGYPLQISLCSIGAARMD